MKRCLFLMALLLVSSSAGAQVYTDGGYVGTPAPPAASRYRLRNAYPVAPGYPGYPVGPNTSPDTAEVGRPYYYPYAYPYGYPGGPYGTPGISSDGDSVYVPGR